MRTDDLNGARQDAMASEQPPRSPGLTVRAGAAFYGAMAVVAYGIVWVRGEGPLAWVGSSVSAAWALAGGAGAGIGLALVAYGLARVWSPAKRLEALLSSALGPLGGPQILALALCSGLGEELLFRGALQPWWGLWITSAVFGLVHGFGTRELRVWTITAFVAGLALGGLADAFGGVLAPAAAHVTVNAIGLYRLGWGRARESTPVVARSVRREL